MGPVRVEVVDVDDTRTQHRRASRQVNDRDRVSGTHRVLLDRPGAARGVLRNSTCPPDVLAAGTKRSDTLRAAAVAHPSCPAAVYKALLGDC